MNVPVQSAIASDTWAEAVPTAGHSGPRDGVLDRPVSQPACIAPVQTLFPGLEELREGGQSGVLLLTGLLGSQEAHVITATRVLVGKHHTWVEESVRQLQDVLLHRVYMCMCTVHIHKFTQVINSLPTNKT